MIKEVEGDILLSKAEVIAHGVAPNDHFAHGLALSLRERWPSMAKDFRHYYKLKHPKPGEIWSWGGVGGLQIVNLMTQEPGPDHSSGHPGKASTKNVGHALKALRRWVEKEDIKSVALPALATGVGGLEWSDVEPLVAAQLGDLKIPVYVYTTYRKGVQAEEG